MDILYKNVVLTSHVSKQTGLPCLNTCTPQASIILALGEFCYSAVVIVILLNSWWLEND